MGRIVEISRRLEDAGAICIGGDDRIIAAELARLLVDPAQRTPMIAAGRALVETGRGALAQTLAMLQRRCHRPADGSRRLTG